MEVVLEVDLFYLLKKHQYYLASSAEHLAYRAEEVAVELFHD